MKTFWVVVGSTGEWSDRSEWNVCVVATEREAKDYVLALQRQYQSIPQQWRDDSWENEKQIAAIMTLDPKFSMDYTGTRYRISEVMFVADFTLPAVQVCPGERTATCAGTRPVRGPPARIARARFTPASFGYEMRTIGSHGGSDCFDVAPPCVRRSINSTKCVGYLMISATVQSYAMAKIGTVENESDPNHS